MSNMENIVPELNPYDRCREEMYYKAVHGTAVLFLQNAAGFAKWEPTAERIQELLTAYRLSGRALASPGTSSSSSSSSSAGGGGASDKDSKAGPERSASLDIPGNQGYSSPGEKTTPDASSV